MRLPCGCEIWPACSAGPEEVYLCDEHEALVVEDEIEEEVLIAWEAIHAPA